MKERCPDSCHLWTVPLSLLLLLLLLLLLQPFSRSREEVHDLAARRWLCLQGVMFILPCCDVYFVFHSTCFACGGFFAFFPYCCCRCRSSLNTLS